MTMLEEMRNIINQCDKVLVETFEKRMNAAKGVYEYKKEHNLPVYDAAREAEVIKSRVEMLDNPDFSSDVKSLFENIMSLSRNYQMRNLCRKNTYLENAVSVKIKNPTVCFQGVKGSYSDIALGKYFTNYKRKYAVKYFKDVFEEIKEGRADYGILPVENSSTGSVTEVLDLLNSNDLFIVGEYNLPINHCLLGIKGAKKSDIKEVYSHSQGLMQCKDYLDTMGDIITVQYVNTAISAKYISEQNDISKAAIASCETAEIYNLDILDKNINFNSNNCTKFVIVSKNLEVSNEADRVSIVFSAPHTCGSLYKMLTTFSSLGLNLVKIESRPFIGKNFEYIFFIDFSGNLYDNDTVTALNLIKEQSNWFKFLGNY